ncbi:hypothetical protein [Kitasatospora paranensis]|uniref:Uncharacterized protein n=1 Tax=Kitasatospora paranensis TaxID=258053 RepID=A0ABW2G029_9ACTN
MAGIEDAGPPVLQPCPSCGLADQVAGVPAVYLAGRDSVRVTTPARFDEAEQTVTREVTTALSQALAPAPQRLTTSLGGCAGVLLVMVSVGTFLGGGLAGHWFSDGAGATDPRSTPFDPTPFDPTTVTSSPHQDFAFLGWISALAMVAAVALFVHTARRRSAHARLMAGQAAAERLWSQGWYCRRCGSVHFRAESGGRALSLQEFRAMVWQAGGYGHLVDRTPVAG